GVSSTTAFLGFLVALGAVFVSSAEILSPDCSSRPGANGGAAGLAHAIPPLPPRGLFHPWFLRARRIFHEVIPVAFSSSSRLIFGSDSTNWFSLSAAACSLVLPFTTIKSW